MTKDWISVKDLASIKGVTERAVRKAVNQNKYVTRMVDGTTGAKYEILVESLDYNIQNVINFEKTKNNFENKVEPSLQKITQYPTKAKQIALARYDLVNLWVDYIKNSPLKKTESGKEFLEIYNKGEIYSALYKILGHVAIGTIYRWQKEIKNNNNFENLIPKYDYGEKEHGAKLTQNELIVFKSLLLSPNKVNIGKATRLTKHILAKRGLDSPSSVQTFRRFANNYRNKHYDEWTFAREGQKALRDKVEPYIKRDISKLDVGDVLVADGHRLAVQCINPYTGKPCRPTLIGYLDWKSTALVGYEIMLEENTQAITSALRNSIINLGKIPKICYQDNGKAFKSKFFKGNLQECGIQGLFDNLGIIPVFAQPYNAKAKVIERFFRELQDGFERLMPSFVGANIIDKPAYLNRNEKFHKKVHNDFIPTIEQLSKMLDYYMDYHRSLECPNVKGKTIGEVFESGKGSGIELEKLDDLMMSKEIKTINRNGIRFLNADYYNDCLYGLKERVQIKYSLLDLTKIKVYTLNNEFICYADRVMPIHPMATYLGDVKDQEELKQKLKQQKSLEKQTVKKVQKHFKSEHIKPLEWQNKLTKPIELKTNKIFSNKQEEKVVEDISDKKFMTRYERYEWHLKNGFSNDKDVAWFKEYETTEEFKEIFGNDFKGKVQTIHINQDKEEHEAKICKN